MLRDKPAIQYLSRGEVERFICRLRLVRALKCLLGIQDLEVSAHLIVASSWLRLCITHSRSYGTENFSLTSRKPFKYRAVQRDTMLSSLL